MIKVKARNLKLNTKNYLERGKPKMYGRKTSPPTTYRKFPLDKIIVVHKNTIYPPSPQTYMYSSPLSSG